MFSSVALMVTSIVFCCIFAVAAFVFFIMWIASVAHGGLQKACPNCSALVPSSASYCTHCGKPVTRKSITSGGRKSFLVIFGVCFIAMGISIAGIMYGAVSSDIGDSTYSNLSVNLKSNSTSSGWNISFDSVKSGWLKKNIHIDSANPKTLYVQSHLKSGSMRIEVSQNGERTGLDLSGTNENSTIDLSKFTSGKVALTVTVDNATGGGVTVWWE